MSRLLACLVLAIGAGPLSACINDVELPTHEREFRFPVSWHARAASGHLS